MDEIILEVLEPSSVILQVTEDGNTQQIIKSPDETVVLEVGGAKIDIGSFTQAPTAERSDFVSENLSYYGWAVVGSVGGSAVWRVAKAEIVGNETIVTYADSGKFTQIWDNRSGLTYA